MKKFRIAVMSIAIFLSFTFVAMPEVLKKDISQATIQEIQQCQDIGPLLADEIYSYVQKNNVKDVNSLKGKIKLLGEKRIDGLKKKFR